MAFPTTLTTAVDGVTEIVAAHLNALETKVGINSQSGIYVVPGTNTISAAVAAMGDGSCLILGTGTYTQTEAMTIPDNITKFSIIGKGIGISNIIFTADVNGFLQADANDRLVYFRLENFSMIMNVTSSTKTAMYFYCTSGNDHTVSLTKNYTIQNVDIRGTGTGKYWGVGIRLEDAFCFVLSNVNFDGGGVTNTVTAVKLESCVNGSIIGGIFTNTKYVFDLPKGTVVRLYDGDHGTEGINFIGVKVIAAYYAIQLGENCYVINVTDCIFDYITGCVIIDASVSGNSIQHHVVKGNWFSADATFTETGWLIYLKGDRNTISNNQFYNNTAVTVNGILLGNSGGSLSADNNIISNNQFRTINNSLYVDKGDRNVFMGNVCTGSGAADDVVINSGDRNNLVGNILPQGYSGGTNTGNTGNILV